MDIRSYIQLRGGHCSIEAHKERRIATVKLPLPTDSSIKVEATSCQDMSNPEEYVVLEALAKAQKALDGLLTSFITQE